MRKTSNKSQTHKVSAMAVCKSISEVLSSMNSSAPCLTYKGYSISYPNICDMLWQGLKGIEKENPSKNKEAIKLMLLTNRILVAHNLMMEASGMLWDKKIQLALARECGLNTLVSIMKLNTRPVAKFIPGETMNIAGEFFYHNEFYVFLTFAYMALIQEARSTDRGNIRKAMLFREAIQALFLSCIFRGMTRLDAENTVIGNVTELDPKMILSVIDELKDKKYTQRM